MTSIQSADQLSTLLNQLIRRRDVLRQGSGALAISAIGLPLSACNGSRSSGSNASSPSASIPAPTPEYTTLKRSSFGVTQASLAEIRTLGIDNYLQQQLEYESIDDGDLETTIANLFPLSQQSPQQLIPGFPDNIAQVVTDMVSATQYRQIYSKRQLYEVMVEFWSDHFNIHLVNGLCPTLKPHDDINVIRQFALGNFGDLLRASAASPAMLFYLDNFANISTAPNENYARELMELHTLGVDGGYDENDIKEVARCFTGWSLNFPDSGMYGSFVFQNAWHDDGEKQVLGQIIPAGGGQSDGQHVLSILLEHPSCARFIASKLCRRFISDTPDEDTVASVAAAFTASSGDIKTTLRALFSSEAFLESADLKVTRPGEYLAQIIRALGNADYPTDQGQLFYFAQLILGQLPFYWPTPDGYPDHQGYWASTGGLLNRWRMSFLSLAPFIPSINVFTINYAALLDGASTISQVVAAIEQNVLMRDLSARDRQHLIDGLVAVHQHAADATLPAELALSIAPLVAAVLISSSYFQLR